MAIGLEAEIGLSQNGLDGPGGPERRRPVVTPRGPHINSEWMRQPFAMTQPGSPTQRSGCSGRQLRQLGALAH